MKRRTWAAWMGWVLCGVAETIGSAALLVEWDFSKGTHGWLGNPQVAGLAATAEGLILESLGDDPWVEGPSFRAPKEGLWRVTIEMSSAADTSAELFYGASFSAERSVRFPVSNDGRMHEYVVMIPESTGPTTRLRLDPCQRPGKVVIGRIRVEGLRRPVAPVWPAPALGVDFAAERRAESGVLVVEHHPEVWNGVRVRLGDRLLAVG